MPDDASSEPVPSAAHASGAPWLAVLLIGLGCVLVYAGALSGPFVFDDEQSIVDNPTLFSPLAALSPPRETPMASRPLPNLTLAFDRMRGGLEPFAFHFTNLVLHALVALFAWAVLRRTFGLPAFSERVRGRANGLALAVAVLFVVHPMTVEVVLYASQRTESLCALCYLGVLYAVLRAHARGDARSWPLVAVLGVLGAASKEVFVTAPVVVLCFDRAFLAGSFGAAWRARRPLYLALCASWVPLVWLQRGDTRPDSVRFFELPYLLAQAKIVPGYLASALLPLEPVFDHGPLTPQSAANAWPWLIALGVLALAACVLAFTHPRAGFLGVWVLGILAPTSTLFSIHTEVGAERRFYLPLLGVLAVVVWLLDGGLSHLAQRASGDARRSLRVEVALLALASSLLLMQSRAYAERFSDLDALWSHAVEVRPGNPRAHYNLAETLRRRGDLGRAEAALRHALALDPSYVAARVNLGGLLLQLRRPGEALEELGRAARGAPGNLDARFNHGIALGIAGRLPEAARELAYVVEREPRHVEARLKLAYALFTSGRAEEARAHLHWLTVHVPHDPRAAGALRSLSQAPAP